MDLEDTDNLTIFAPTEKGKAELKAARRLSTIALELMVMFDGVADVGDRQARHGRAARADRDAVTAAAEGQADRRRQGGATPDGTSALS